MEKCPDNLQEAYKRNILNRINSSVEEGLKVHSDDRQTDKQTDRQTDRETSIGSQVKFNVIIVQVGVTKDKGRGVFADHDFCKGDYICEYHGDLTTKTEGLKRQKEYKEEEGNYLFFFDNYYVKNLF